MPRPLIALGLALLAVTLQSFAAAASLAGAGVSEQPRLVQPESLDQGFILLVTDKSGVANSSSPLHLASNHNGWNPNDPAQRLTQRSDGRWQIVLPKPTLDSRMAFKFARGSWDAAETDAEYKDIENRSLPQINAATLAPGEKPVIELVIETFADQRPWTPARAALDPYRPIQATGTVRRIEVVGGGVPIVRDVMVWLPPGYDDAANADRRYPVLYLHDGQNVFEQLPGVPGEWRADETATALIESEKIEPLIIVAIPHAGPARSKEYLPIAVLDGVTASGDDYVEFLVRGVMPRVERAFRVRSGPGSTAVGGASFGAIISLHAATMHPDRFGMVLAESPPMLSKDRALLKFFEGKSAWPRRVYIGMGGREAGTDPADSEINRKYAESAREIDAMLAARGLGDADRMLLIDPGAVHNEDAWAARFGPALEFLFPARDR